MFLTACQTLTVFQLRNEITFMVTVFDNLPGITDTNIVNILISQYSITFEAHLVEQTLVLLHCCENLQHELNMNLA